MTASWESGTGAPLSHPGPLLWAAAGPGAQGEHALCLGTARAPEGTAVSHLGHLARVPPLCASVSPSAK